jgi:hypothetical protein
LELFKDIFRELEASDYKCEAFIKITRLFEDIFREIEADVRLTSILPVLSKGIERFLCDQFVEYIESCGFLSRFQSGFKRFHSTATAFTSIMNDIHLSVEKQKSKVKNVLRIRN